ncbi:peroxide stress protein YaaA [Larsenimonas suaedae]|uniref:UPF0246 protein QC825_11070 n=1 Tax=Larsenimonas suaedae TaxID=1851019 RepID=A0ABU1GYG7_9GAMM|nr:peroxide stress protein YaaA [Larsenimonas suaedae]MCM2973179.1 peroxide stress protein YaaA [Larsenimonas suaedae]MDR5896616.1 peroxide stress protein YaaA [Larsenimonas suaedae]
MLSVISPAKTLDFETPPATATCTYPDHLDDSARLIDRLKEYTPEQLATLMGLSDKLAGLNVARYAEWQRPFTQDNAKQAVLAFQGDVYQGLDAPSWSQDDFDWAQSHLRILSGLYGLLRPLDLIQPYRLEMGTKLANERGKDLYAFWTRVLSDHLEAALLESGSNVLINLASNEYFKAVDKTRLSARIITPVFKDEKNGSFKIISFYAKKARGLMGDWMIRHRLDDPEALKAFDVDGYQFSASMSQGDEWVFIREEASR